MHQRIGLSRISQFFVTMLLLLGLFPNAGQVVAQNGDEDAVITFNVGICDPSVNTLITGESLPRCTKGVPFDSEARLAWGTIYVTNMDTGETRRVDLDGDGWGRIDVYGNQSYVAYAALNGTILDTASLCGSSNGIAGSAESGVYVGEIEDMDCSILALNPDRSVAALPVSIELKLYTCPGATDSSGFMVGDGVLDCNDATTVEEGVPFGGATFTVHNLDTNTSTDHTTADNGYVLADALPAGFYSVSATYLGQPLDWVMGCGGSTADGTPLGMVGSIQAPDMAVRLDPGFSLSCTGYAVDPNAIIQTADNKFSTDIAVSVFECDQPLDWSQITGATTVDATTIGAVDTYFQGACTTPGTITGTFNINAQPDANGDVMGSGSSGAFGPTFTLSPSLGGTISFKEDMPSGDFWLTCSFEGYDRSQSVHINNDLNVTSPSFQINVPSILVNPKCAVYHIPATGTMTHVLHFCESGEVDSVNLTCSETAIPVGLTSFVGSSIWTDVPQTTSAFGTDYRIYAGQRWNLHDGFNRFWTHAVTPTGSLVLTGQVPLGELAIGASNIRHYPKDSVLVYCGSAEFGWSDSSVHGTWQSSSGDWLQFEGRTPVGVQGAPNNVTCHWFISLADFSALPVVNP